MPDQDRHELLPEERSHSPAISSPLSNPPRHRPTYVRVPTTPLTEIRLSTDSNTDGEVVRTPRTSTSGHGLGIIDGSAAKAGHISLAYGPYTPPPAKSSAEQHTPDSSAPLISSSILSGSTRYGASPMGTPDFDSSYNAYKHAAKQSVASLSSSIQPSQYAASEAGLLPIRERYDDHGPHHNRNGQIRFKQKLGSCFSTLILLTACLSACLSGLLLVVALVGPRYGRMVHTRGAVTAANAAFITSLLAKAVEISFGTIVIAFLGQALGRRAFNLERPHGVTLAEISMRNWIMSPGTIVTNWSSVKYAGTTVLGIVSLLSALAALLYTSAATALVQPQLKLPDWSSQTLQGLVKTQFANVDYMMDNCKTPIQVSYDKDYAGSTCVDMEHAAMAYHNYFGYLNEWASMVANGNGSIELSERPKGYAVINDNTTVIAPWVEQSNVTALWDQYELLINNVSMAMPHPGVLQAAVDPLNANVIMQPDELDGLGNYHIRASVPSPVVHVLCVTVNESVLQPFVYQLWQNDTSHDNVTALNMTTWPSQLAYSDPFLGHTILHDIFGWGINSSSIGKNWPPVFPKLPSDYNTILNDTNSDLVYGRDSIYILGKGGDVDAYGNPNDQNYGLCQLKSSLTPYCSTQYNASQAGGTLEAVCEDPHDDLQYIRSMPTAPSGNASISRDWPEVAVQWALSKPRLFTICQQIADATI
nr:hypothetical protein CFP56_36454 [Quercus suber]